MSFESTVDWDRRRKVILDVQARNGMAAEAAEILGMKVDTLRRSARELKLPFSESGGKKDYGIDWNHRQKVILAVQKAGGTASRAAEILGIKTDTVLKTARKLGVRFPSNNGYHNRTQRARPVKPNGGQEQSRERMKTATSNRFRAIRFANALAAAPEQPKSDAELIAEAIAAGKVTKVPDGFGLLTTIQFVGPRAGAQKGMRL